MSDTQVVWRPDNETPSEIARAIRSEVEKTLVELVDTRLRVAVELAVENEAPGWVYITGPTREQIVAVLGQIAREVKRGTFVADRRPV